MALLGDGILISGGTTSMADLDETMRFQAALLSEGVKISGGATSMADLDEAMRFASTELASSKKATLNIRKPVESVTSTKEFTKTGV